MSKGFDINAAESEASAEDAGQVVHVRDANGDPMFYGEKGDKPITITVAGTYSKVYRAALNRQRDRMLRMRRTKMTGEMLDEQQVELAAACVLAWEGFTQDGQPVPCTRETARVLMAKVPWLREQVEEAMNDHAGFSQSS